MNSSSESILSVVVAGVARSDTFLVTGALVGILGFSVVAAVESCPRRLTPSRGFEDWPVADREPLVAALEFSLSEIAASAAFLFLVRGGVVKTILWQATGLLVDLPVCRGDGMQVILSGWFVEVRRGKGGKTSRVG